MTCERKWQGGGKGWYERGSLDFFCVVEFPRRGKHWQGHSPAKKAGRKPQAGVMLPKKGLEEAEASFTARIVRNGCTTKGQRETCGVQHGRVSFLIGSGSPPAWMAASRQAASHNPFMS